MMDEDHETVPRWDTGTSSLQIAQAKIMEERWHSCTSSLLIAHDKSAEIWAELCDKYCESHRSYHTLQHLQDLFELKDQYAEIMKDHLVIDLAIFFHDIIYDPKSSSNEEDSVKLFLLRLTEFLESETLLKVATYIQATKQHDVMESSDNDLKLFIDLDMSILGRNREEYEAYASKIRFEYSFVNPEIYCEKRSAFLEKFANQTNPIFASKLLRERFESRARENLTWECCELRAGRIP